MLTSHLWCSIKSSFETLLDSHTHAPTHIIPSFMWSALGIISILHGKRRLAHQAGEDGGGVNPFLHTGPCCVSVSECVELFTQWAAIWQLCPTTPHFFSCGPDSLGSDSTHAGPRDNQTTPPSSPDSREWRGGRGAGVWKWRAFHKGELGKFKFRGIADKRDRLRKTHRRKRTIQMERNDKEEGGGATWRK